MDRETGLGWAGGYVGTGVSTTNLAGRTLRDLVGPDEADGWVELYRGVLTSGRQIHFERDFIMVKRVIEVSATRVEPPELRQVSVLFRDITARKAIDGTQHGVRLPGVVVDVGGDM